MDKKAKPVKLSEMIGEIWGPQIESTYGLTFKEFGEYVKEHDGELPPLKDFPFGNLPACWPHLHCDHP